MNIFLFNDYQLPIFGYVFMFSSTVTYWLSLAFSKNKKIFKIGQILAICSNIFFGLTLIARWTNEKYFPLSNLYESLIFLSWGLSTLHLFLEQKMQSRVIGSITAPLVCFISSFASLKLPLEMQKALSLVPSLQSNWLMMHVSMMMISYTTLIIGSLISILYLIVSSFFSTPSKMLLKKENADITQLSAKITKMSLLETMDSWSYRIIGLGFPFLTIGIISGAVWANEAWGSYWSWDPKETWALITWLVFAIYLHARLLKGWEGKKAATVSSIGFFIIWICYLGVNFLGKGLHTYGWVSS